MPAEFEELCRLIDLGDSKIIMAASDNQLRTMQQCRTLFLDGTFKTCPRLFSQIYVVRGETEAQKRYNLGFALMPNRLAETYRSLFRHLKAEVMRVTGNVLSPPFIMTDFEASVYDPIRGEFPASQHKGCWFHYMKALYRKLVNLGYTK